MANEEEPRFNWEKPGWLRSGLSWFNWYKGEWFDKKVEFFWTLEVRICIPPFDFTPGEWIESAIDWGLYWINETGNFLLTKFDEAYSWAVKAWNLARAVEEEVLNLISGTQEYIFNIEHFFTFNIYGTLSNAMINIYQTFNVTLDATRAGILGALGALISELIDGALASIKRAFNLVEFFYDSILEFFSSPLDWLLDQVEDWFWGKE